MRSEVEDNYDEDVDASFTADEDNDDDYNGGDDDGGGGDVGSEEE